MLRRILGLNDAEVGGLHAAKEDVQVEGNALEAEHVIAVGTDFDLELGRLLLAVDNGPFLLFSVFVELDTVVEAQVLEFGLGEAVGAIKSANFISTLYDMPGHLIFAAMKCKGV